MVSLLATILCLAFATTCANARTVRIPLYRSSMRATRLKGTNPDVFPPADKPDLDAETSMFVPLVEEVLIVKATFGEPPQFFNLTLDTKIYYTTLFSPKVGSQYGNYNQHVCYGSFYVPINATRNWFQQRKSRTLRRSYKPLDFPRFDILGYPYTNECGSDSIANTTTKDDYIVQDTFSISNLSLTITPVSVVDNAHFMLNPHWPSDGILGINRYFPSHLMTNANNSALERILTAFDGHNTTATIVLDGGPITGPTELGGWITFGGKDEEKCVKEWIYAESSPAWNIKVTSFSLGRSSHNSPMDASIDTMSTFIRLPQPFVDNVIGELGALYDFESDTYYVDCADVSELPDLSFRIALVNLVGRLMVYNVPARDYARQVYSGLEDRCYLMLTSQEMFGYADTSDWLSLGTTFMRSHCIMLDYSNGSVAVAEKRTNEEVPQ